MIREKILNAMHQPGWHCIACENFDDGIATVSHSEVGHCSACRASWRDRAVIAGVLQGVGVKGHQFSGLIPDWSRRIIGIGDSVRVASILATKFDYTNTHIGRYPILDLHNPPEEALGSASIVICSDVLEHVDGSIEVAVKNLFRLINPGGFAIVSVPLPATPRGEFYPNIRSWEMFPTTEGTSIRWTDNLGTVRIDHEPEFHSAPEPCLVFRSFSQKTFTALLESAGFFPVATIDPVAKQGVPKLSGQPMPVWIAHKSRNASGLGNEIYEAVEG